MRYEDWDVVLLPVGRESKIPFKEFRVACHVVPDYELSHVHGSSMPVMTCFVPSLAPGMPFQVSIHCWRTPQISQFTQAYSRYPDLAEFEARIQLDGRLVASTPFDRGVYEPHLITRSFEFTKTGELERLKFPHFRRELLFQNHWNASDDVGRIKVTISEGFPRDSLSVPIERVKNVVAFSFQHAPLEILESNGIAWPNPSMWRRPGGLPFNPSMPVPTFHPEEGADLHTHSPRRKSRLPGESHQGFPDPFMTGNMFHAQPSTSFFGGQPFPVPYLPRGDTVTGSSLSFQDTYSGYGNYADWILSGGQSSSDSLKVGKTIWPVTTRNPSKHSSTDASMPDYVSSHDSDRMHISGPSLEDDPMSLKVPTNTPTTGAVGGLHGAQFPSSSSICIPSDLAASLTQSLLNQPLPIPLRPHAIPLPSSEIKSRKENRHLNVSGSNPSSAHSTPHATQHETRKFSQPVFSLVGSLDSDPPLSKSTDTADNSQDISSSRQLEIFSANVSRNTSGGEFGSNISNLNTGHYMSSSPTPHFSHNILTESDGNSSKSVVLPGTMNNGSASNQGTKRGRHFTPVSAKVIDEEDEPKRGSPHVRITGYAGGAANEA